jgi:hypothetical protein
MGAPRHSTTFWLLCSLELHLLALLVPLSRPQNASLPVNPVLPSLAIEIDPEVSETSEPDPGGETPGVAVPVRPTAIVPPRALAPRASANAAPAPTVVAAATEGADVPAATTEPPLSPVGPASPAASGPDPAGAGNDGADAGPGDLSSPAHLQGQVMWACKVRRAPPATSVHVRVLVNVDGSAERVEPYDVTESSREVVEAALPCALRQRYIAGTDSRGLPVKKWSRPFRVVVAGLM